MHSISSKYRKPKGRPSKRRAAYIRNLEKGKSSACNSSSDSKCDEISTGAVPSTSDRCFFKVEGNSHIPVGFRLRHGVDTTFFTSELRAVRKAAIPDF
ncbi:hypothetical protein TNCT_487421 [Trichonephila clavata]|uniref:Uncharacterized protein n=1 Tax=Trichonephila clavata TaxID=2740835 RepID=A0A8X6H9L7_TRICU|nr:hypothetical protein TNCT_487421 [Trichonephila clavata]